MTADVIDGLFLGILISCFICVVGYLGYHLYSDGKRIEKEVKESETRNLISAYLGAALNAYIAAYHKEKKE